MVDPGEGKGEVVLVCGGTGGHLAPGIAMAQRFRQKGVPVLLVISSKPVDRLMLKAYPEFNYKICPGVAFSLHPKKITSSVWHGFSNLFSAFNLLRRRHPVSVFCFGGFLTPGFALSCAFFRIPLFLHESNQVPGRALRLFGRFAKRAYCPEGMKLPGLRTGQHLAVGMPLRQEAHHVLKDEARSKLSLSKNQKILLLLGGSQGAKVLNVWFEAHAEQLALDGIQVICVTGDVSLDEHEMNCPARSGGSIAHRIMPFHPDIPLLLSAADVALCRAGAGTIAEIIRTLTPSVLVPYPYAADDHQERNARNLEARAGGVVLLQEDLDCLYSEVADLIFNDWLLAKMRENLRSLERRDAGDMILQDWFDQMDTLSNLKVSTRKVAL